MSEEIRCSQGLTKDEYQKTYCKAMSREALEFHWAGVFFECLENGMKEKLDATDYYNVLKFIKSKNKNETYFKCMWRDCHKHASEDDPLCLEHKKFYKEQLWRT